MSIWLTLWICFNNFFLHSVKVRISEWHSRFSYLGPRWHLFCDMFPNLFFPTHTIPSSGREWDVPSLFAPSIPNTYWLTNWTIFLICGWHVTSRLIQMMHSISWPQWLLPGWWGVGSYGPPWFSQDSSQGVCGNGLVKSYFLSCWMWAEVWSPGMWWRLYWDEKSRKQLGK